MRTIIGDGRSTWLLALAGSLLSCVLLVPDVPAAAEEPAPDRVVSPDGSGDFRTIQAALAAIPRDNRERLVILIRDGVYREKIRIDASCVTLRGQSRKGTRIEFPQLSVEFEKNPDPIGRAVVNIQGDDVVLENLTASNTALGERPPVTGTFGQHAFTVSGRGDRTITLDCDFLSDGADTVALWEGKRGRYYHARCHFRGGVDFFCPRGWCYATDCTFFEVRPTAALWHDGSKAQDQKLVVRHGAFDGVKGWYLGRHHHDAAFYLLDCTFSETMADRPLARHVYNDPKKDQELDKSNRWGERCYYRNCHREGGDYAWYRDNLDTAEGAPVPEQINAAWTFGGTWDPEDRSGPAIAKVEAAGREVRLTFSENVTVKGKPRLRLKSGAQATYAEGSGSPLLVFRAEGPIDEPAALEPEGGAIIASSATVRTRHADRKLPR
jgi:pectinesterase